MHIVVCMKQVPDATEVKIDPRTNTLVRDGVPAIMNPYDVNALEEALRLKDVYGGKVTVLSMGPPQAVEMLQKTVGLGADQAILLSDRAFAGSDTLATSYILARAIEKISTAESVDLVFCGKQAIDGDTAQVGPGIASRLGWTLITYVLGVKRVSLTDKTMVAERKLTAVREVVEGRLPAVLTVEKDINEIRYASLPGLIKGARYQPVIWNKDDLAPDAAQIGLKGSPTSVNRIFAPPQRSGGEIIPGGEADPAAAVRALVERVLTEVTKEAGQHGRAS